MMRKVLVLGSGGREDSLGFKFEQEGYFVFHGTGTAFESERRKNVPIDVTKKENFLMAFDFVKKEGIELVVVGPEVPLSNGIVDFFNAKGREYHNIFGSTAAASALEDDKFFSYDIMSALGIPQADSVKCYTREEAIAAIKKISNGRGCVAKTRGLTGGKGVSVYDSKEQALEEIVAHSNRYGQEVLIAERLFGQEASVLGISDGSKVVPLLVSFQDHKRLNDGDKGPNTGGMGAYGPAPIAPPEIVRRIADEIMTPVVRRMKEMGREYKGFLYAGMMMTKHGPKVLEFNVRFGDPECQPAMMLLESRLSDHIFAALNGTLDERDIRFREGAACCVVLTSRGYPGDYKKDLPISGLDEANGVPGVTVFHAGTKRNLEGQIVTSGGRVLGVTGYSPNGLREARERAYEAVSKISIPGGFHYRTDIASKAL